MASLIDFTEAEVTFVDRADNGGYGRVSEWLRLDLDQEPATVSHLFDVAWQRVETRIPNRYAPRSFTAIVRADRSDELVSLPLTPIMVTTVELFDPDTGLYAAQGSLKAGPELSSVFLPSYGTWRLTGTAGPTPAVPAPQSVQQAVLRLVAYLFERRGDFDDHTGFHESGAADLLRQYVRV